MNCADFSPDSLLIVTGSRDNTARLWEVASGKLLATFTGHENAVVHVVFSPDGTKIATGSIDQTVRLWEVTSGKLLTTLIGHRISISSMAFSPEGRFLITGDYYGRIFLWLVDELECGRLISNYVTSDQIKAFHWYDETHVIVADAGGPSFCPHLYLLKLEGI